MIVLESVQCSSGAVPPRNTATIYTAEVYRAAGAGISAASPTNGVKHTLQRSPMHASRRLKHGHDARGHDARVLRGEGIDAHTQ